MWSLSHPLGRRITILLERLLIRMMGVKVISQMWSIFNPGRMVRMRAQQWTIHLDWKNPWYNLPPCANRNQGWCILKLYSLMVAIPSLNFLSPCEQDLNIRWCLNVWAYCIQPLQSLFVQSSLALDNYILHDLLDKVLAICTLGVSEFLFICK